MNPGIAFWIIGIVLPVVAAIIFPIFWGLGVVGALSLILGAYVAIPGNSGR